MRQITSSVACCLCMHASAVLRCDFLRFVEILSRYARVYLQVKCAFLSLMNTVCVCMHLAALSIAQHCALKGCLWVCLADGAKGVLVHFTLQRHRAFLQVFYSFMTYFSYPFNARAAYFCHIFTIVFLYYILAFQRVFDVFLQDFLF